ncbi:MAG: hypothetical protein HY885_17675 [Deltaproteobacteria bacterium]|nr:hypothetical protein [Deltaproteobacteria bacterium]
MKKPILSMIALGLLALPLSAGQSLAGKPVTCKDTDGDGYGNPGVSVCPNGSATDCNNNNSSIFPGATEICGDGIDQDCSGADLPCSTCIDTDGDGYGNPGSASCPNGSATDCNNSSSSIFPGATEIQCDGIDQDCSGADLCSGNPHQGITGTFTTPAQVTAKCLECHPFEGNDIVNALHGMMPTASPKVTNATGLSQKLAEINTFCSYPNPDMAGAACLTCHPTLGKYENLTAADIDCLRCHNDQYKSKYAAETDPANFMYIIDWQGNPKTYIPSDRDANGNFHVEFNWAAMPGLTALDLVRGVQRPTTTTCLSCHAKAGGGDWVKRGDIGLNSASATAAQDVHLASVANGGAGLSCGSCHVSTAHEIPGRGIDLRPTEGGAVKACVDCHTGMDSGSGHASAGQRTEPDRHVARVACQSCHIPAFAKGGATEMWRDWTNPTWNAALCNGQGAWAGEEHKVANVAPDHVFFNGTSYVYKLGQTLNRIDPISGYKMMADANGAVSDAPGISKLVPIKRHQSNMAVHNATNQVIPFDVVWQFMTGKSDEAAANGMAYAGLTGPYTWTWVEAEMAINHGVSPATSVATCAQCHGDTGANLDLSTLSKLDKQGYALKDTQDKICGQCHRVKSPRGHESMHGHLNKGSGIDCLFCHNFTRPERGLCSPCDPNCVNEFVDNVPYNNHVCN